MTRNTSRAHLNKMRSKNPASIKSPAVAVPTIVKETFTKGQHIGCVPNIMAESAITRKQFGRGPLVNVYIGQEFIASLPQALLEASSANADDIVKGSDITLPDVANPHAVDHVLVWLGYLTTKNHPQRLHAKYNLEQDMAVLLAAHLLGLSKYTKHIESHYRRWMMNMIPCRDDIESIMATIKRSDDPMLLTLASRIAYLIRHKQFPYMDGWERFLAHFPNLANTIEEVDAPHREARHEKEVRRAETAAQRKAYKEWRAAEHAAFLERDARREARRLAKEANIASRQQKTNVNDNNESSTEKNQKKEVPKAQQDPRKRAQKKEEALKTAIKKKVAEGITQFTFDEAEYGRFHNLI